MVIWPGSGSTVQDTLIEDNKYGIALDDARPVLHNITFQGNHAALWLDPGSRPDLGDSTFRNNTYYSYRRGSSAPEPFCGLGTLAAAAVYRSQFFGREAISFLLVLPIALPGIVTGIALRSAMGLMDLDFSFWTIVIGHATFCIVVVYNNVLARFRRTSRSLIEASMDLGANGFQTFRYIVLPTIATALLAGGMLAFALSFDEVIVTTFTAGQQQTLPIWIFAQLTRPRDRPVTNVVAFFVIAVTFLPILWAHRLTQASGEEGEK